MQYVDNLFFCRDSSVPWFCLSFSICSRDRQASSQRESCSRTKNEEGSDQKHACYKEMEVSAVLVLLISEKQVLCKRFYRF